MHLKLTNSWQLTESTLPYTLNELLVFGPIKHMKLSEVLWNVFWKN